LLFFVKSPTGLLLNCFRVMAGRKSWVGYCKVEGQSKLRLPEIRQGVLCPVSVFLREDQDSETLQRINILYARDYNVWKDVGIFLRAFRKTGQNTKTLP